MDTDQMPRFTPPTPRSRRLGRELRRLREQVGFTLDEAGRQVGCSPSRISRIESGEIKSKPGAVIEILMAYDMAIDDEQGRSLVAMARDLRMPGWWQRLDLPPRYATYISYEAEASAAMVFEPLLVPGLLQTEAYARAIIAVGRLGDQQTVEQRVAARMTRQEILTRKPPLRLHAVVGEPALHCAVGDEQTMAEQMTHLRRLGRLPTVRISVLPYTAGAALADGRGFIVLRFAQNEPALAHMELANHELFVEAPGDVARLVELHEHLQMLSVPLTRF